MYGIGSSTGMMRPLLKGADGMELIGGAGFGTTDNLGLDNGKLSTAGNGTITNQIIDGQLVYRTGPGGAYTDTFDTAANLDAGIGAGMNPGDALTIWYSNQVAFVATIAGAAGVTLRSTKTTLAASAMGCLILVKRTNAVPSFTYNSNGQQSGTFTSNGTYDLYVL